MASDEPVLGTAEPLSPQQAADRLRELEAWGVDLSLVRTALARTPAQRLDLLRSRLTLIENARRCARERFTSVP